MKRNDDAKTLNAAISREILQSYEKLLDNLSGIADEHFFEERFAGTGGLVSIANLLAYQIGWGCMLIRWYESGINHQHIVMPGEGFSKWDYTAISKHFYHKYATLTPLQLKQEFHATVQRLIEIAECEFLLGNLDKLAVWPWCRLQSGKEWPLSKWVQVNTVAPYKRATKMIQDYSKSTKEVVE